MVATKSQLSAKFPEALRLLRSWFSLLTAGATENAGTRDGRRAALRGRQVETAARRN